jgi:hypothetical protein
MLCPYYIWNFFEPERAWIPLWQSLRASPGPVQSSQLPLPARSCWAIAGAAVRKVVRGNASRFPDAEILLPSSEFIPEEMKACSAPQRENAKRAIGTL